jgi:DNA polymerase IV (DinB-like DNA polymerase)
MQSVRNRIIFHVDMDGFFSAVEVREKPELKGMSVVVGSDPKNGSGRGVVSTCSYEARESGIRSGMPISKAYRLCPDAVFLPVNMKLYKDVSTRIMEILRSFTNRFQQTSVDEAYLDVSGYVEDYESAVELAQSIKNEVVLKEGLTCSIGVAHNRVIAKIASDFEKPDGLTVVTPMEVDMFLSSLPAARIPGIGKKSVVVLKEMGIQTIGDLAACNVQLLIERFGKSGLAMHQMAKGIDLSEVKERGEVKSISKEDTFDEDTADPVVIEKVLDSLADDVYRSLVKKKFLFRTVTLKVRFEEFSTYTRSKTLGACVSNPDVIKRTIRELIREFMGREKFRLLGVGVSKLEKLDERQMRITDFL